MPLALILIGFHVNDDEDGVGQPQHLPGELARPRPSQSEDPRTGALATTTLIGWTLRSSPFYINDKFSSYAYINSSNIIKSYPSRASILLGTWISFMGARKMKKLLPLNLH